MAASIGRRTAARVRAAKGGKPSQTPGRQKIEACQKSELKSWGAKANPYKLSSAKIGRYEQYCALTSSMNK